MRHSAKVEHTPERVALSLHLTGASRTKRGFPAAAQQWYFTPGEAVELAALLIGNEQEQRERMARIGQRIYGR